MMSPKQIATLQAEFAIAGGTVSATTNPGDVMRMVVALNGIALRYLLVGTDPALRVNPPCPVDQDPETWTARCDRVVCVFEPLLADALGMPASGRMTRHLSALPWLLGSVGEANGCKSGSL